jgi:hypothetical protein
MIQFVSNYDDLSTERGYQFKFYCDKCRNGYLSEFALSKAGTATSLLSTAGGFLGGIFGRVSQGAYEIQKAVGGKAHDEALQKAVADAKKNFRQCTRCGHWVCAEVCWNAQAGLCESCAPDQEQELAAQQAQATAEQIATKTREQNYTKDINFQKKTGVNHCPKCGVNNAPGAKFCSACGGALYAQPAKNAFCSNCGSKLTTEKFCPQCGAQVE